MRYIVHTKTKEHEIYDGQNYDATKYRIVEADEDGWIEWEGGERPLPASARVDVRLDTGEILTDAQALAYYWGHSEHIISIVAYRPILDAQESVVKQSLTTEQAEQWLNKVSKQSLEALNEKYPDVDTLLSRLKSAHEAAQSIPDLEKELREVLDSMGYDLVARDPFVERTDYESNVVESEHYAETTKDDMSDWRNWREGDLVVLQDFAPEGYYFKRGKTYRVRHVSDRGYTIQASSMHDISICRRNNDFRFHSRPEQ